MERRFAERKAAMLAECVVSPQVFSGVKERLAQFIKPFSDQLTQSAQRDHAADYLSGLVSDLKRKNVESIAYRHDQDRRNLQHFIGCAEWDSRPLIEELVRQVGRELGEEDGVIVFDPSGFPKKGKRSVGVARQWCGRLGKVENCQVGVYMAYVSRIDHTLVDCRLYLPKDWANDRVRRKVARVPRKVKFQTRHEQALEMLQEQGRHLPHRWVAGDDEMGRNGGFRRDLHAAGERYLLAVPSNTLIRDLDAPLPERSGRGAPRKPPYQRVDAWREALPQSAWTKIDVRDAEKGRLEVEVTTRRVTAKLSQRAMKYDEVLVIVRSLDEEGATKHDYYLSDAPPETPRKEFARVALSAHRVEEAIKRGKSEAGLADYEVRNWHGWHHHQTLAMISAWFLVSETLRGKKMDLGDHGAADPRGYRHALAQHLRMPNTRANRPTQNPPTHPK